MYGKYRYFAFLTFLHQEAKKQSITGITNAIAAFGVHTSTSIVAQREEILKKDGRSYLYLPKRKPTMVDAEYLMKKVSGYANYGDTSFWDM